MEMKRGWNGMARKWMDEEKKRERKREFKTRQERRRRRIKETHLILYTNPMIRGRSPSFVQ
jgi:hypothetical protein